MSIKGRFGIVLCFVLSACAGQITPTETPFSQYSTPSATPTRQNQPIIAVSPTIALVQSNPAIPVTGAGSFSVTANSNNPPYPAPTNENVSDKFQNFSISLIPVTGFPPGVITGTKMDIPSFYDLTEPRLVIPVLDVNISILGINLRNGTWDISWLWDEAGWLEGTAYPTRNGNSVLTAHVVTADGKNGPFVHLKTLTIDDYVFIYNSGYRYIYKVDSIGFIKPNDMSIFSHEDDSWLTLITCDSYDEVTGTYLLRVFVRARLVEIQDAN